jgi:hypothetical protein
MRRTTTVLLGLLAWAGSAVPGFAQGLGSIAGVVRDGSGAVLPGVTVEASSAVLIEKSRTVVTDGAGQYTIVNLPVGTYSVAFTLPGFSTVKREGIETLANFVASVNADMRVGDLEETITVTGESPIVDVRSATTARAVTPDIIRAVPSGATMYQLASMMTGVVLSGGASVVDVGGLSGSNPAAQLSAHGGLPGDEVQMLDGIKVGNMQSNAGRTGYTLSPLLFDQVDVVLSGQLGDSPTLGVQTNAIPRSGGNTFSGTVLANGSVPSFQSNNLTDRLSSPAPDLSKPEPWGLTSTSSMKSLYDVNASLGGPIVRDRLWFYGTGRYNSNQSYVATHYYARYGSVIGGPAVSDIATPTTLVRVVDSDQPAFDDQFLWDTTWRFTAAASPNMRVTGYVQGQHKWYNHYTIAATISPEATPRVDWPRVLVQGTWTYTPTNRLLLEAGANRQGANNTILPREDEITGLRNVEQGGTTVGGIVVPPMTYGAYGGITYEPDQTIEAGKAAMTYATGTHNVKVGMDFQTGHRGRLNPNFSDNIQYRSLLYNINQATVFAPAGSYKTNLDYNIGLYLQDRWAFKRLSTSAGLRFTIQKESYDAYTTPGSSTYLPNRVPVSFPAADVVSWRDVDPRIGLTYDLFGTGKTALKFSAARAVIQEGINTADSQNPAVAISTSVARTVNRLNSAGLPDCDLTNPLPNGGCGAWLTSGFGEPIPQTVLDPLTLTGWGVRPWNWEFSTGVQHELMRRVSIDLTYYRRIYGGFLVTDNTANVREDFTAYGLIVPADERLPASGQTLTAFEINPVLRSGQPFSAVSNFRTFASNYGNQYEHWNGFDIAGVARLSTAVSARGGVSFGQQMTDNCEIVEQLPEVAMNAQSMSVPREYCHNETGWQPQYKLLALYELPWWGLRVSGNWNSRPGTSLQAGVIYSQAQVAAALGRNPSGGGTRTVNEMRQDTVFGDRLNQIDLRFSRIFRFGTGTLDANVDLYNAFNSDAALSFTNSYSGVNGGAWMRPTAIVQGRLLKLGVRWDF